MYNNSNDLLEESDYSAAIADLATWNENSSRDDEAFYFGGLDIYSKLVALRDQGFPLLLRNGKPYCCQSVPFAAYLLPPINQRGEIRWLLLFFATQEFPLQVQIVEWSIPYGKPNLLKSLNEPLAVDAGAWLREAPLSIEFHQLGSRCFIQTVFQSGNLDMVAELKNGIVTTYWSSETSDDRRTERASFGTMNKTIYIAHHMDDHKWRDDGIFDENDTPLVPRSFEIGWINGADSPIDRPDWVYLASTQTRVFRIDKKSPAQPPWQSPRMAGMVLDVLIVKDKYALETGCGLTHAVLAATQNGRIYFLSADESRKRLAIDYWQPTGDHHIVRLIGFGGSDILAIDERGEILPLRVADPERFIKIKNQATERLAAYFYCPKNFHLSSSIPPIEPNTTAHHLARLALEYFLVLNTNEESSSAESIKLWLKRLNDDPKRHADIQAELICRLTRWMQQTALRQAFKERKSPQEPMWNQLSASQINIFFDILTPDESAPDELWLPLLRHADWVRLWAENTGLMQNENVFQRLVDWETRLQQMRARFLPGLAEVRPLVTNSSRHLASYANHIEVIDEANHLIAVSEYAWGIRIYKLTLQPEQWEPCAELCAGDIASGQILFLRKLPCKELGQEPDRIPLLIGTIRGELVLLIYDTQNKTLKVQGKKINCGAAIICSRDAPKQGIWLGGRNPNGGPVLFCWAYKKLRSCLSGADQGPVRLWSGAEKTGALRLLRLSVDGRRLWAINREKGSLYAWEVPPGLFESAGRILLLPEIWYESVNKLHALEYSQEQQLLVWGDGGMALAFDDQKPGVFRWVVNGEGNMRRIRYLPDYSLSHGVGAWLLCGHYQSSLIVDKNANVLGVLEKAGPVSAITVVGSGPNTRPKLLIGTLDGRLMAMRFIDTTPEAKADPGLTDTPSAYPVRWSGAIDTSVLLSMLDISPERDSLCNMRVLKLSANYLRRSPIDPDVHLRLLDFLFLPSQPLERRVVFLYWLRANIIHDAKKTDLQAFALALIERWIDTLTGCEERTRCQNSGLLCKVLSPMLDVLDAYSSHEQANALRKRLTDYLWIEKSNPAPCSDNSGLTAARWNQSFKRWRKPGVTESELPTAARMFAWCNLMAKECGAHNVEPLKAALSLLTRWTLSFLPQNDPWRGWIPDLIQQKDREAPYPLNLIETPRETSFNPTEIERLENVFADNTAWLAWLSHFQSLLNGLDKVKNEQPHRAWKEMLCLESLREWIVSIGKHRFSVEQEQTLLALWWERVESAWQKSIDSARQRLHQQWIDRRSDYLCLSETFDRWQSDRQVELGLMLVNRCPEKLHIEQIHWQTGTDGETQLLTYLTKLPVLLLTEDEPASIAVKIETALSGLLKGTLVLSCKGIDSGESFFIGYELEKQRNITRLSEAKQWRATWDRLDSLLSDWNRAGKSFYWLEGDLWAEEERALLRQAVKDKYDYSIQPISLYKIKRQLEKNPELRLFSPDLALGASPEKQLEQLHDLLAASGRASAPYWLLAFWSMLKQPLPGIVWAALWKKESPDPVIAKRFLISLGLSDAAIHSALSKLPPRALGAWCRREPFHVADTDVAYPSPASSLPPQCWRLLDKAKIPDQKMAEMLGCLTKVAAEQRQARAAFYAAEAHFFKRQPAPEDVAEHAATAILKSLTDNRKVDINRGAELWWTECRMSLNWNDYTQCLLLPKMSAAARERALEWAAKRLPEDSAKVWLCLGEETMPDNWPGFAVSLSSNNAMRLLHAENLAEAQRFLNQLATEQGKLVNPWNVFQSAGGLGRGRIGKHFGGRKQETSALMDALKSADSGGHASALIIGGRRMGKTTLREKILFEIEREELRGKRRVYLDLNWEGIGDNPNRRGVGLEYWFMNQLKLHFMEQHGIAFDPNWNSANRENKTTRDQARQHLRKLLDKLKQDSGHVPLFIFDETENLVRLDAPINNPTEPWSLFKFLRDLINKKKLVLFATCYPMGLEALEALNVGNFNADSPLHNTFPNTPEMLAWPTDVAWDYLDRRLSGLGVLLPQRFRDEYLNIGRGIPWIAHAFGLKICECLPEGKYVVDTQTWNAAKQAVLHEILNNLKVPVISLANELDLRKAGRSERQKLGNGRLWQALRVLAGAKPFVPTENQQNWPKTMRFSRQALQEQLPDVPDDTVRELLRRLSSSPVLEGIVSQENEFVFTNNLLPAWLYYSEGKES